MKKVLLTLLTAAVAMGASAQGLDLQSRAMLKRNALEKAQRKAGKQSKASEGFEIAPYPESEGVMAFVTLNDGYTVADLEEAGMTVNSVRGDIAIVGLPLDSVESWAKHPSVKKMSLQRQVNTKMNLAREDAGVDAIHGAADPALDMPYTGKGVLAMIVDQGMDPNNISFLDDQGVSRVKYLSFYDGTASSQGIPNVDYYGEDIVESTDKFGPIYYPKTAAFVTDDASSYHGTHTMNIMAGSYKGDVQVSDGLMGTSAHFQTVKNPYYGVATDAWLAASCGSLADACIALGIDGLLSYAYYRDYVSKETQGVPVPSVLSLSLGATSGPHDPNGMMNRFLEEVGKETIVVLASGNEGDLKIALRKNLTAQDNKLSTMIYPYAYRYDNKKPAGTNNTYVRQGYVVVYSDSEKPFQMNAYIMTGSEGNYRKRASYSIDSEEGDYYLSNTYYQDYVGGSVNTTVQRYFDGYIGGGSMYDPDLGRYYGIFDYYLYTDPSTGFNEDGSEGVIVGFEVIGEDGQRIEAYADGFNTWMSNYGVSGYDDGQRDGTISDMAVGNNVLVVGAYTLRNRWTSLDGEDYGYFESDGFVKGDMGQYTSYGTLNDGRTLPHVCAPGSAVVSAASRPFVESYFKGHENQIAWNYQAKTVVDGKTYYWGQETGTSMSTPFVAGSIALWLEADPTLTIDDVIEIVQSTARRDAYVERGNPVQWGAGKFDALAGLKEVIRRATGIKGITNGNNDRLIMNPAGNGLFDVFVGEASSLDVKVYSMAGSLVHSSAHGGNETTLDLSGLGHGIYVVTVNGHSKKISL